MDVEQQAGMNAKDKVVAKVYHGREGGQPPYKTRLDAKAIDPSITLDWTKSWFKLNVEPKTQVWGKRNSYVAPHAYFEYQAGLFFVTPKQCNNQKCMIGFSMIDVFSKYAVVVPVKENMGKM